MCHLSLFTQPPPLNNDCWWLRQLWSLGVGWQDCQSSPTRTLHQQETLKHSLHCALHPYFVPSSRLFIHTQTFHSPRQCWNVGAIQSTSSPLSVPPCTSWELFTLTQVPLSAHYLHAQESAHFTLSLEVSIFLFLCVVYVCITGDFVSQGRVVVFPCCELRSLISFGVVVFPMPGTWFSLHFRTV